MARIRSVHPSLFTDEAWVSCSPLARILYIGLWTDADDQGLFEWKPLQIKMRLLPGDGADASELLQELVGVDLITSYEVDGKRYGAIRAFRKFQRPQKPNAIHPLAEEIGAYVGLSENDSGASEDHSATGIVIEEPMEDGGGKEGEKNPPTPRGGKRKPSVPLPDGFPTDDLIDAMQAEAREAGANFDVRRFATYFRDQCAAKDHRYADWPAAWRKWCRGDIAKAPRTATAALSARRPAPEADRWRKLVREFRANGYWPSDDAGPAPGRPGCRAPPGLLAEFGIKPPAANDAPLFAQPGAAA
jgi:hypothetical protein